MSSELPGLKSSHQLSPDYLHEAVRLLSPKSQKDLTVQYGEISGLFENNVR